MAETTRLKSVIDLAAEGIESGGYKFPEVEPAAEYTPPASQASTARPSAPGSVPFREQFEAAAVKYGVPVNALMAIADKESSFNPTAANPTSSSKGLMGFIDGTAKQMGIDALNPEQSIDAAARMYADRKAKGMTDAQALAAHYGGDGYAKERLQEAEAYAADALRRAKGYRALYEGQTPPEQAPAKPSSEAQQPAESVSPATRGILDITNPVAGGAFESLQQNEARKQAALQNELKTKGFKAASDLSKRLDAGEQAVYQNDQADKARVARRVQAEKDITDLADRARGRNTSEFLRDTAYAIVQGETSVVGAGAWLGSLLTGGDGELAGDLFDYTQSLDAKKSATTRAAIEKFDKADGFIAAGSVLINNPAAALDQIARSAPAAIPGTGVGIVAARAAAARAAQAGLSKIAQAAAAGSAATIAGRTTESVVSAGMGGNESEQKILRAPFELLEQNSERYRELAGMMTPENARARLAKEVGIASGVLQGIATGAGGFLAGRANKAAGLGDTFADPLLTKVTAGQAAKNVGGEVVEEVVQSPAEQFGQNVAERRADNRIALSRDVGKAAAAGAIGAIGQSGVTQAAGLATGDQTRGAMIGREMEQQLRGEFVRPAEEVAAQQFATETVQPPPVPKGPLGRAAAVVSAQQQQIDADAAQQDELTTLLDQAIARGDVSRIGDDYAALPEGESNAAPSQTEIQQPELSAVPATAATDRAVQPAGLETPDLNDAQRSGLGQDATPAGRPSAEAIRPVPATADQQPALTETARDTAPVPGRAIKSAKVVTPAGRDIDVEYQLVEADDLITSNDDIGNVNPAYPQALQPRDRTRTSSQMQVNDIASNLNPRLLAESPSTTDGAPIISADGVVESGNGRTLGIKRAYVNKPEKAAEYRAWLDEQGYNTEGMTAPVLVRVRKTPMSADELIDYTRESNERTTLGLSATERAMADAKAVTPIIADFRGGDITSGLNAGFVRKFMQGAVGKADQGTMLDAYGQLTQEGRRRIEGAIVASAYGDSALVTDLFESADNDIKGIGGALMDVAPAWAKMRSAADSLGEGVDITNFVMDAVNVVKRARNEGRPIMEFVRQTDIFSGEALDPVTTDILRIFFRGENMKQARSRKLVAEALTDYAEQAMNTQAGEGLFGDALPTVTPTEILRGVNEKAQDRDGNAAAQQDIFSAGPKADEQRPAEPVPESRRPQPEPAPEAPAKAEVSQELKARKKAALSAAESAGMTEDEIAEIEQRAMDDSPDSMTQFMQVSAERLERAASKAKPSAPAEPKPKSALSAASLKKKQAEKKTQAAREMDESGRAKDGKPIMPGDVFKTLSGRETAPYPKQKGEKYASQWLIDSATAEARARGDEFNARTFSGTKTLNGRMQRGQLTQADRDGMLMYLFGEQPAVVPSILRPPSVEAPKRAYDVGQFTLNFDDQRPGAARNEKEQKALSKAQKDSVIALRGIVGTVLGNGITKDFQDRSATSLIGKALKTSGDLAALAQVYRNPSFETLRYVFVKGDKVVHTSGISSRLPGESAIFPQGKNTQEGIDWLKAAVAGAGADGWYMTHNHPSGNPGPSQSDVRVTLLLADKVPGFKGHVVINHTTFSHIDENGRITADLPLDAKTLADKSRAYSPEQKQPHSMLGGQINGPSGLANYANALSDPKNIMLVGRKGTTGAVTLIAEIDPDSVAAASSVSLLAAIRKLARQSGSVDMLVASYPDSNAKLDKIMMNAVKGGAILDAMSDRGVSLRSIVSATNNGPFGARSKGIEVGDESAPYAAGSATIEVDGKQRPTTSNSGAFSPASANIKQKSAKADLYVGHNLSAENLRRAVELGGLAAPSLGISRTTTGGFSGYGEITLLAPKEIIESSGARTFNADVYSPRQPRAVYKIDSKKFDAFIAKANDMPIAGNRGYRQIDESEVSRYGAEALARIHGVQMLYLSEIGQLPKPKRAVVHPVIKQAAKLPYAVQSYNLRDNPKFIAMAKAYYDEQLAKVAAADEKRVDRYRDAFFEADGSLKRDARDRLARDVQNYIETDGLDATEFRAAIARKLRTDAQSQAFSRWLEAQAKEFITGQQLQLSPSRKIPYTLDNVVAQMTKELRGGEGFNYGGGNIRAMNAAEIKSIREVQNRRDEIVSAEDFKLKKDESGDRLSQTLEQLKPFYKYDAESWGYMDDATRAIADGPKGWRQAFRITGPSEKIIRDYISYVKNLPTEYFETKMQRAVGLSEFSAAVVPNDTPADVIKILEDAGLTIKKYNQKIDGARTKAIAGMPDLLFKLADERRGATPGMKWQTKASLTAAIKDRFGSAMIDSGKLLIHENQKDAEIALRGTGMELRGRVMGFVDPLGRIHMVANNIAEKLIGSVLVHEAFHSGVEQLIGSAAWNKTIKRLAAMRKQGIAGTGRVAEFWRTGERLAKADADHAASILTPVILPELHQAEEFGAYALDAYESAPKIIRDWADEFMGMIKAYLLKTFGVQAGAITPAQLRRLSIMALKAGNTVGKANAIGVSAKGSELLQKIRAFHGSPFLFDEFKTENIGTGEGAQAYGYGLYFAGRRDVAEFYRKALTGRSSGNDLSSKSDAILLNGSQLNAKYPIEVDAAFIEMAEKKDVFGAFIHADGRAARWAELASDDSYQFRDYAKEKAKAWRGVTSALEEKGATLSSKATGALYEVEIPEEGEYLLWDKTFDEQPEKVKDALRASDWSKAINGTFLLNAASGSDIYQHFIAEAGFREPSGQADKGASLALRGLGIAGIKYLDGQSRNKPLKDIKREFLEELPQDAEIDDVMGLLGSGTFSPANEAIIRALNENDWLGFDYPSQAISAALGDRLNGFDPTDSLVKAISDAQDGGTYNYVVFSDEDVRIVGRQKTDFGGDGPSGLGLQGGDRGRFDLPEETGFRRFQRSIQDDFNAMNLMQRAVVAQGGKLTEANNTYLAYERMPSKVEALQTDFNDKEVKPFIKRMTKAGLTLADVAEYAYAKHAPSRNAYIATINDDPKFRGNGSGMSDVQAAAITEKWKADPRFDAMKTVHADLMAISKGTRDLIAKSGLESKETVASWDQMFDDYVPLIGFENVNEYGEVAPKQSSGTGKGLGVRGRESKSATGRVTAAGDIIENLLLQRERAIVRSEKLAVDKHFLRFVLDNPDPSLWVVNERVVKPVIVGDGKTAITDIFSGEPTHQPVKDGRKVKYMPMVQRPNQNTLSLKVNGREVLISIKNDLIARQLNKLDKSDLPYGFATLGMLNRFYGSMWTAFSPTFAVLNYGRDYLFGLFMTYAKVNARVAGKAAAYAVPGGWAMKAVYDGMRGKDTPAARWFNEYRHAGGKTGMVSFDDVETKLKKLKAEMDKASGNESKAKASLRYLADGVQFANNIIENAYRLALYRAATENGMTRNEAASLAKNATVNFNRRGEQSSLWGSLYMFFNAGVQGTAQIAYLVANNRKFQAISAGIILSGIAAGVLGRAMGGEDDDGEFFYDKVPAEVKRRNIVIMAPAGSGLGDEAIDGGGRYWKIPFPYGLAFFKSIGDGIYDKAVAGKPTSEVAANYLLAALTNFNPVGDMVPSVVAPFVEVNVTNKDGLGRKIMPEQAEYGLPVPDSERYWPASEGTYQQRLAKYINEATGGNEVVPGSFMGLDTSFSPESMEHIFRQFTGGIGTMVSDIARFANSEEADISMLPFAKQVQGKVPSSYPTDKFYERASEIGLKVLESELYSDTGNEDASAKFDAENAWLLDLESDAKSAKKQLTKLNKEIRAVRADELPDEDEKLAIKELRAERTQIATEFNTIYNKAKRESETQD